MSTRHPPAYFSSVRERARRRWVQLEGDPELAGPWRQLFGQVQSPRHVLSELLQNADDAGARRVRVSIVDGRFVFEHDGKDFNEEEFASLCRFGFSNKRKLHTIGFRGVGFKSTFSLGKGVEVLTPSLAVRFHKRRFTEPVWIDDAPPCDVTQIAVGIQDSNREKELKKNLQEWIESPASLLFFNHINELTIGDDTLRRRRIGPGPLPDSARIRLTGHDQHDVIVFDSPEEPFPQEAVDEIRQERDVEDLHLPPCRVQLVIGLPGEQRLYVVLPTGVAIDVPFSCNAPFLQDPARTAIKNPSLSPTNRWLLHRLGRLAGKATLKWLRNRSQEIEGRAKAYCLLPAKPDEEEDSLEADATSAICQGFAEAVRDKPLLLTTAGRLVDSDDCISPPRRAYSIWTPTQLLEIFGNGEGHVLSGAVTGKHRQRLESWDWLGGFDEDDLIDHLAGGRRIPRPTQSKNLLALWSLVHRSVRYDYGGQRRRRLAIVPVEGTDILLPAGDVVRLSTKKETINDESWAFLVGLLHVIDRRWVEYLSTVKDDEESIKAARKLLNDLNLNRPSNADIIVANACRNLFQQTCVSIEDHVRIAHLMAALDARTPMEFYCITRDSQQRKPSDGIIATQDSSVEDLLPEDWAAAHLLYEAYFRGFSACTRQQWEEWVSSKKSGFLPFVRLNKTRVFSSHNLKSKVRQFVQSRGSDQSPRFYAQVQRVEVSDFGFPDELVEFWNERAEQDTTIWAKVAERILASPSWYWEHCLEASLLESNYTHTRPLCSPVTAEWISFLSSTKCLYDIQGHVRVPAELYLRTPATEPLMEVEPFVRAELDTEATKPLLRLLGVRDTPAGLDKLLERIRALARAPDPALLLSEIMKWYRALDKALARCDADDLEEVRKAFAAEPLILTDAKEWAKSSAVFQYAGEDDLPDAPVVYPAANDLGMWARLGVANRPTADLVLDWLKGLPSGESLEPGTIRPVRAALQRYPVQVWQICQHWLSLDSVWTPVERLRFRLTMHSLTRWADLFPAVKAATANLQMLSAEVCDQPPFASLPDLGTVIKYRLTNRPTVLDEPTRKPWLAALANALMRVKLADEADTERVRRAARRLARSVWQPFNDYDSIQVTPYVDEAPAGQPHSPDVLWHEETIFVRDGRLAKSFDALVAELARPFTNGAVTEAIKACIERDKDFIADYMEEHFTLEDETGPSRDDSEAATEIDKDESQEEEEGDEAAVTEEAGQEEASEETSEEPVGVETINRRRRRLFNLFKRYAMACGYRWDPAQGRFIHPDGSWIGHCPSPFHWRRFDAAGNVVASYWVSRRRLESGVEIAAELWEMLRGDPTGCCLVLLDGDGRPRELPGPDLIRMVNDEVIALYPAKYRMREESNA